MAEFVEQCFHFVHRQQGRSVAYRFGEAANIAYQRTGRSLLFTVVAHPCAAAFSGTREIVYIEDSELGTVSVFHFKDFYVRMVGRDSFEFTQSDAVKFVGYGKCAFTYIFQFEVGLCIFFGQVVFFFA